MTLLIMQQMIKILNTFSKTQRKFLNIFKITNLPYFGKRQVPRCCHSGSSGSAVKMCSCCRTHLSLSGSPGTGRRDQVIPVRGRYVLSWCDEVADELLVWRLGPRGKVVALGHGTPGCPLLGAPEWSPVIPHGLRAATAAPESSARGQNAAGWSQLALRHGARLTQNWKTKKG